MFWYWLGQRSGYSAAKRRGGQPIGCATVLAWLLLLGLVIAFWKVAVPVIVGLVIAVMVAAGYVSSRRRSGTA